MSHVLSPPTPLASLRGAMRRAWENPDSRSVLIGLIAVVVVHLLLLAAAPALFRGDVVRAGTRKAAAPRQFNIDIAPQAFVKVPPKPPLPNKYVEANPNAPDNVPDKTTNFSSQNSQLAQEKPQADAHNDAPKTEGKKDIESNQVVSGQLSKPQDPVPVAPEAVKTAKTEMAAKQQQDPLAGFEKMKEGDDGFGSNLGKVPNVTKPAPVKVEGAPDVPLVDGAQNTEPLDRSQASARPPDDRIDPRPSGHLQGQRGWDKLNMGAIAFDAKWSNYGAYLHRMIEAIQIQWERILLDSRTEPPSGSYVTVKFTLDSKGRVTEILDVENNSSEQGKSSCLAAITNTAPYGDWTDDMIAILGNSQELTFRFYYQ